MLSAHDSPLSRIPIEHNYVRVNDLKLNAILKSGRKGDYTEDIDSANRAACIASLQRSHDKKSYSRQDYAQQAKINPYYYTESRLISRRINSSARTRP